MRQNGEQFAVVKGRLLKNEFKRADRLLYYLALCHTLGIRVVNDRRGVGSTVMQTVEVRNEVSPCA